MLSKWAVCDYTKSKYIKKHEVTGLLRSLGIFFEWNSTAWKYLILTTGTNCVSCKEDTANRLYLGRLYLVLECVICDQRISKFVKPYHTKQVNFVIYGKKMHHFKKFVLIKFWMIDLIINEIANKFWWAGDKFMTERHLKQPRFTILDC